MDIMNILVRTIGNYGPIIFFTIKFDEYIDVIKIIKQLVSAATVMQLMTDQCYNAQKHCLRLFCLSMTILFNSSSHSLRLLPIFQLYVCSSFRNSQLFILIV